MSQATSGDGTVFAIVKQGGEGPPPVFTQCADLRGEITPGRTTIAAKNVRPRGATVPTYIFSPAVDFEEFSFGGNFIFNDATHDETNGLRYYKNNPGTIFGMQFQGPDYSADTIDDLKFSGAITGYQEFHGEGENEFRFECSVQRSGIYRENGAVIGSAT